MGMFDTIIVPCPECGKEEEFQTKSGECILDIVKLEDCDISNDMLHDVNRHSPYTCENCNTVFDVDISTRKSKRVVL